jgi:hypothetical protein
MMTQQNSIPEPIEQLEQQLAQWRSTNQPRARLPETLWTAAVELARPYGVYRTAHLLRLDYVGLKGRVLGELPNRPESGDSCNNGGARDAMPPHVFIAISATRKDRRRVDLPARSTIEHATTSSGNVSVLSEWSPLV